MIRAPDFECELVVGQAISGEGGFDAVVFDFEPDASVIEDDVAHAR